MKIYTKTGDQGDTQVYANEVLRKRKDDSLLQCYGTLDELNSQVGLLLALHNVSASSDKQETLLPNKVAEILSEIQKDIFNVGFALSNSNQLRTDAVTWLESIIDNMTEVLPAQTRFILPGGSVLAAHAHICRTVARRAERELVSLHAQYDCDVTVLQYINRLSDMFFVFARLLNHSEGVVDTEI